MADPPPNEFERLVRVRHLPAGELMIEADATERARLAGRLGIYALNALTARVQLDPDGEGVRATGTLTALIEQDCAVAGEPFASEVKEPLDLLFVPEQSMTATPAEEVELAADELDEVPFTGDSFDLGEALAQTLALAIDPYAEGPYADRVRAEAGIGSDDAPSGPLAEALAGLKLN